jgi:hypothetical protein
MFALTVLGPKEAETRIVGCDIARSPADAGDTSYHNGGGDGEERRIHLTMTLDQACQLVRRFKRVTSPAVVIFVSQPGRARSYAPIFFGIFNLDNHNLAKWFCCFEDCQSKLFTPTRVFMLTGLSVLKYFL